MRRRKLDKSAVAIWVAAIAALGAIIAAGIGIIPDLLESGSVPPTESPTAMVSSPSTTAFSPTRTPLLGEETRPEGLSPGDTWVRPADGMVMVYVPGGEFEAGSDDDGVDYTLQLCDEYRHDCEREWFEDEQPMHPVALDGFWIDQTEVTNAQYRQCVEAGDCDPPPNSSSSTRDFYHGNSTYDDYPVIYVSWHQANAYCEWAGTRLPTEAEWEYAARGTDGWEYPWGNAVPDATLLNYNGNVGDTTAVGSYPDGASWCGALDMAGNVWEWVADWYASDYYRRSPSHNPTGPSSGEYRVLRGGAWINFQIYIRCAFRLRHHPDYWYDYVGFRCARGSP